MQLLFYKSFLCFEINVKGETPQMTEGEFYIVAWKLV